MANIIEKNLPKILRERMRVVIGAALGLFLGLQYNDYIKNLISMFVPNSENIAVQGIVLIILTIAVVYITIFIEKSLDGK